MRTRIQVSPRQAAMLASAQQQVNSMLVMLIAGSPYERATLVQIDTDRNELELEVPDPVPQDGQRLQPLQIVHPSNG